MLEMNIDKVLAGRPGVRFFFPLCGKAVDMKWYVNVRYSPCTKPVISLLNSFFLCGSQVSRQGPFSGRSGDIGKSHQTVL